MRTLLFIALTILLLWMWGAFLLDARLANADTEELDKITHLLANLAYCESRNKSTAYNANDAGSPSYGLFQYKEKSWHYFLDKYGLFSESERHERMNLIWDRDAQNIVTKTVILNETNWQKHWKICSKSATIKT